MFNWKEVKELKIKRIIFPIVLTVIVAFVLVSCAPKVQPTVTSEETKAEVTETTAETTAEAKKEITIGYAAPWLPDVGQVTIMQGLIDGAMKLGWKVITTDANGDVQKQINDIDNLITMGVDAVVSVPQDSAAIVPAIEKCNQLGIPFFTIDRGATGGKIVLTVLADNYLAGKQEGDNLIKLLTAKYGEPKGKVLELQGDLATNVAQLRGKGFDDVVAQNPNIKLIQVPTKWAPDVGAKGVEDTLTTDPDLDAVYFHSEYTGAGVVSALDRLGKLVPIGDKNHIIILGIDGSADALNWIRNDLMDSTSSQPLYDFGIVCSRYIKDTLEGVEIKPGTVEEPGALWSPAKIQEVAVGLELQLATTLVTKENVDDPGLWGNVLK
jgi:ABC-type sugar transport system substrate-binding protein